MGRRHVIAGLGLLFAGSEVRAAPEDPGARIARLPCATITTSPLAAGIRPGSALFGIPAEEWREPLVEAMKRRMAQCAAETRREAAREIRTDEAGAKVRDAQVKAAEQAARNAQLAADRAAATLADVRTAAQRDAVASEERTRAREARFRAEEETRSRIEAGL
ncbi:hypothetical protein, partial [Enterovirga sp. CN4-39]|uniref:hypothetical protein n=1 Tax=Enterovirga sp. CN4-39 TaxID=3400910 RepID=UPI003C000304